MTKFLWRWTPKNENENSHWKSTVPVLLRGEIILLELRRQVILASRDCLNSQNSCLKSLTHTDAAKVKPSDLSKEIQEVINGGKLPSQLADSIDAIRNIGNFAAHPIKGKSTGEIVDVEPEEAEWNLDVLESLFDFYYVQPAKVAKKRDALNAKLSEAGKPPMK